ncbi:hypothetical protein M432DRAFT_641674 [Thermoascus aurantiacus ATCC 26904]
MSLYRRCWTAAGQVRGFASSASLRVGPESPNFIDIPKPIQPDLPSKPRVKGTLPVPRELFPARRRDKPSEAYIAAATPPPSKEPEIQRDDPNAEYNEWRRKMAETRRRNLREGLLELYERKQRTESFMRRRSRAKQARRERILNQPEREDERLTKPSIIQAMMPTKQAVLPDPDREERLARSKARLEAREAKKKAERQDALHTLYVNARNFITTEAQLNAEIERVFPEGDNPAWRSDHQQGDNIWNLGVPPTVQSMVNHSKKNEVARWDIIQDRVKQLAEAITGGKM